MEGPVNVARRTGSVKGALRKAEMGIESVARAIVTVMMLVARLNVFIEGESIRPILRNRQHGGN